jgi:hypothetical protein
MSATPGSSPADEAGDLAHELVKRARQLQRLMARRRRKIAELRGLDDDLRVARKLLRDLSAPHPADVYATPPDVLEEERP